MAQDDLIRAPKDGVSVVSYQLVILVYCLINVLFFLTVQPYRSVGAELLSNRDFNLGLQDWRLGGSADNVASLAGVLTLSHKGRDSTVLSQCWEAQALPGPLLLRAEGKCRGVVRGDRPWHESRIDLVGYDAEGQGFYHVPTRLFGLAGDQAWSPRQALFYIPEASQRVCLEIIHYAVPGAFQVRNLSLTQGVVSRPHQLGRSLLLAGWLGLLLWIARPLYRYVDQHRFRLSLLVICSLLLAGVLIPHETRQQIEDLILDALAAVNIHLSSEEQIFEQGPGSLWPVQWGLSKYAHILGFSLLALVLSLARPRRERSLIAPLLLLAIVTEMLQFFVPLRTPRISDLVIDGGGVFLGLFLASALGWLQVRLRRNG
jgi:hypothetical protein